MPTISTFYGMFILMFWDEHPPPHFHVRYNEYKAIVDIETSDILRGKLLSSAEQLVKKWAKLRKSELLDNWNLCREDKAPKPIEPLD